MIPLRPDDVCWTIRPLVTFSIFDTMNINISDKIQIVIYNRVRDNPNRILYIELLNTFYVSGLEIK